MKKVISFLLILFCTEFSFSSVPDTIPNASFENWSTTGWFDYPTDWITSNNSLMAPNVVSDSDAHSGNVGVRLANIGTIPPRLWTGFRLNTRPFNLGGYLKNLIGTNDYVEITVHLYYNQIVVDSGYLLEYPAISIGYTPFIVPITQSLAIADSCDISIDGCWNYLSEISLDDLAFDFSLGINRVPEFKMSVFPNPCNDKIRIQSAFSSNEDYTLEAIDVVGRRENLDAYLVGSGSDSYISNSGRSSLYDISHLHSGTWIILARNKFESHPSLIIKQ